MAIEKTCRNIGESEGEEWNFGVAGEGFLHLEIYKKDLSPDFYSFTWLTCISFQQGLETIRESDRFLKRQYQEIREVGSVRRVPFFEDDPDSPSRIVGPVTIALPHITEDQGKTSKHQWAMLGPALTAVDLEHFRNHTTLINKDEEQNFSPLWARIDTEYLSYYLEGESIHPDNPKRQIGIIAQYRAMEEILKLFQQTSITKLSSNELKEMQADLDRLLKRFPTFVPISRYED